MFCILIIAIIIASAGGSTAVEHHSTEQPHQNATQQLGGEVPINISTAITGVRAQANTSTPVSTPLPQNDTDTENENETPTPTPTSTSRRENLSVSGSISNPTPPGNTRVQTRIEIEFKDPIANGTAIEFNETYTPVDIQLQSVQTTAADTTGSITGSVTQSIIDNRSHPQIRLTTTDNIQEVEVRLEIEHPAVDTNNIYQIGVRPPQTDTRPNVGAKTNIASYSVRPVGDDRRSGRTQEFDRAEGSGFVYSNATVYQGEGDIEFRGSLTPPLRGITGDTEGYLLEPPVATDAPTGSYSSDGTNLTAAIRVQTAKMKTLRVENSEGVDVSGDTVYPEATEALEVTAQSNFEDAEEIELTVQNANGLDITDEVIDTARSRPETPGGNPPVQAKFESSTATASQTDTDNDQSAESYTEASKPAIGQPESRQSPQTSHKTRITNSITAQTTEPVTPERSLNQTKIEPGETVEVTLTGVVGANGRITFAEEFSPGVASTEINSVTSSAGSANTLFSLSNKKAVSVVANELPPGEVVTVVYTIQVGPSDETYLIDGSVTSGESVEYTDTRLIVGSGGNTEVTSDGKVTWKVDLSPIETRSISVSVSGSDDLTGKEATANTDVTVSDESVSLIPQTKRPIQPQNLKLSVENGVYGSDYVIIVPENDLRSTLAQEEYNTVFRNVGTTQTTGVITESGDRISGTGTIPEDIDPAAVFAEVRADPDSGVGTAEVQTQTLADNTTIELLDERTPANFVTTGRSADAIEISVGDSSVALTGPDTYRTQSETTLTGTTTPNVDTVIMYVRTNSGFEQVDLDSKTNKKTVGTTVSGESFSHDVRLSYGDGPGNEVLSVPGRYEIALRAETSLSSAHDGEIPTTISEPEMLSGNTRLQTLIVRDTAVSLTRPGLNGSIAATESFVSLNGTLKGRETALIVGIGSRGSVETTQVDGPNFSDVNLPVDDFANGIVNIYVISTGRDGQIGDGEIESNQADTASASSLGRLQQYIETTAETDVTSEQLKTILRNETAFDTGSDDAVATHELLITAPQIAIQTPAQGRSITDNAIQVRGTTNVRSEDSQIEIRLQKRGNVTANAYLSEWETESWNVTISVPTNASGRYALTADIDGEKTTNEVILTNAATKSKTRGSANMSTPIVSRVNTADLAQDNRSRNTTAEMRNEKATLTEKSKKKETNINTGRANDTDAIDGDASTEDELATVTERPLSGILSSEVSQFAWVTTAFMIGCIIFYIRSR